MTDVRPATRRCARRDRLSFLQVPSFCSLESPDHITHVNICSTEGAKCGGAPSSDQLATVAVGVSSGKPLETRTYLHQATGFVTTANLCLRHADILHNITVARSQPPTEFLLAITIAIIKGERDLRVCVSNLIGR